MDILERITKIVKAVQKISMICYPHSKFKIGLITIFSKSEDDLQNLVVQLTELGIQNPIKNGIKFILNNDLEILGEKIKKIRIRNPDIHRQEIGCGDLIYEKSKYAALRETALRKKLDIIIRRNYEMIELSTFDINVYAYIVKNY